MQFEELFLCFLFLLRKLEFLDRKIIQSSGKIGRQEATPEHCGRCCAKHSTQQATDFQDSSSQEVVLAANMSRLKNGSDNYMNERYLMGYLRKQGTGPLSFCCWTPQKPTFVRKRDHFLLKAKVPGGENNGVWAQNHFIGKNPIRELPQDADCWTHAGGPSANGISHTECIRSSSQIHTAGVQTPFLLCRHGIWSLALHHKHLCTGRSNALWQNWVQTWAWSLWLSCYTYCFRHYSLRYSENM